MNNLFIFIIILIAYEFVLLIYRKYKRRKVYSLAKERSIKTGLPLLVIGDPHNGVTSTFTGADYDCGDICLDITGAPKCKNTLKMRLEDFNDFGNYIVFISCTLEYVDDLPLIIRRLKNMNIENIFVVHIEPYSTTKWLYPNFLTGENKPKYTIHNAPPYHHEIIYSII